MHYLDKKYINLISNRLLNFKWVSNDTASFRCPVCGDSKKSLRKSRGSFFVYRTVTFFGCYNCGGSIDSNGKNPTFDRFLFYFDQGLWQEFRLETLRDKDLYHTKETLKAEQEVKNIIIDPLVFSNIKKISQLSINHPARKYVDKRKLTSFADYLYYVSNFPKWVSETFVHMKKWEKVAKHPRLIFPCYDKNNALIGFTARALLENSIRYCHVKLSEDHDFLFGLERLDTNKKIKILEGNVDSLMIDNAIAVMGSNLNSVHTFTNCVYIYDNQPRNKEICKLLESTIKAGKDVVIWPDGFEFKDLNDAVVKGNHTKESLEKVIEENTFCGIMALVRFNQWKRI